MAANLAQLPLAVRAQHTYVLGTATPEIASLETQRLGTAPSGFAPCAAAAPTSKDHLDAMEAQQPVAGRAAHFLKTGCEHSAFSANILLFAACFKQSWHSIAALYD